MVLTVSHNLKYTYTDHVVLNPHYLYLTPKPSPYQKVTKISLEITPKPSLIVKNVDQESNIQHICYFKEETQSLEVKSNFTLSSESFSPLDFVFYPFNSVNLPISYRGKLADVAEYLTFEKSQIESVRMFSQELAKEANYITLDFLMLLVRYIHENFSYQVRYSGDPMPSFETLDKRAGSCRDYAVLMMDACAVMGIVSQFVSGYLFGSNNHEHELHAWVEVLLPGGGWRGFDPTEGRVVDNQYIALASSVEPIGLNPVRGTFRANSNVESQMETSVQIDRIVL